MQDSICYLNGRMIPLSQATVSVLDRGFIFGDGVYELIPAFGGIPFRLPEHLRRLRRSLAAVMIADPFTEKHWTSIITDLVEINNGGDQGIYLQLSRGVAARDHALPKEVEPTVFLMSSPLNVPPDPAPISAIVVEDIRWQHCDIKSTSLLANVLSREMAAAAGSQEAIFVHDGDVTEGAASNVFVVTGGHIRTPPLSRRILPGVTRDLIVELMADSDAGVREEAVCEADLRSAEEIWVTSSSREMVPVVSLDGKPVGTGAVGPVFRYVQRAYRDYKVKVTASGRQP